MNVLLFLTPKSQVAFLEADFTIRQGLEKMEYHRYSSMPIIDNRGHYIGTITEGDLLWEIKNNFSLDLKKAEQTPLLSVKRLRDNKPVKATADVEDLLPIVMDQNFVPVIDDQNIFIGIVTRKSIIQYLANKNSVNC